MLPTLVEALVATVYTYDRVPKPSYLTLYLFDLVPDTGHITAKYESEMRTKEVGASQCRRVGLYRTDGFVRIPDSMLSSPNPEWRFCRRSECPERDRIAGLHDRFWARQWLQALKGDPLLISGMRAVLSDERGTTQPGRMSDDGIIEAVADLLAIGILHIHGPSAEIIQRDPRLEQHRGAEPPKPQPESPAPSSAPPPRLIPVATEPPTFPVNLNVAAQVATLKAAAAQGAAFCPQ